MRNQPRDETESATNGTALPRTVLVTGAAGFIGSHVVDRLLSAGCEVWGLDNFDPLYGRAMKEANLEWALGQPRFRVVEGDLRDVSLLGDLFSAGDFDAVIHLAARAGPRPSIHMAQDYYDCNLMATVWLLETMRRFGIHNLVLGSSSSVYGASPSVPFAESSAADRPLSPYAATKRAAELACHTYWHLHGIRCLCLRLFTVYGPRQRPDLAIHKFAHAIADGRPVPLYGDGSSVRDYTYVDDVVDAICAALALVSGGDGPPFEVLNIGASRRVALSELVERLGRALGREPLIRWLPPQPGDVPATWADISKARELIGYEPRVDIEEGLRRFVEWFRRAGEERLGVQPSLVSSER